MNSRTSFWFKGPIGDKLNYYCQYTRYVFGYNKNLMNESTKYLETKGQKISEEKCDSIVCKWKFGIKFILFLLSYYIIWFNIKSQYQWDGKKWDEWTLVWQVF